MLTYTIFGTDEPAQIHKQIAHQWFAVLATVSGSLAGIRVPLGFIIVVNG